MVQIDETQLRRWKSELEKEIAELELRLRPLTTRISELREKLSAVNRLLPQNGNQGANGSSEVASGQRLVAARFKRAGGKSVFTPVYVYVRPLLESLVELGGGARNDEVIERVGKKLATILTPADKELLASGVDVRWRNRVAWQRFNLIRQGLLRDDSPRGVWEITDEGRRWLAQKTQRSPAS